jgi:hypothetical protein
MENNVKTSEERDFGGDESWIIDGKRSRSVVGGGSGMRSSCGGGGRGGCWGGRIQGEEIWRVLLVKFGWNLNAMKDQNDDQDEEGDDVNDSGDGRGIDIVSVGVIVRNCAYAMSQR